MRALVRATLAALVASTLCHPYARLFTNGVPLRRPDFPRIQFFVNDRLAAGMRSADGFPMLAPGSDPEAAIQAALKSWSEVPGSAVSFAPLGRTSRTNEADGMNVFVLEDTPEIRSIMGQALGLTQTTISSDGRILETDILFNPSLVREGRRFNYSTTLAPDSFDLQSIAVHELGHALGANHSGMLAAAMFETTPSGANFRSVLSEDDVAFLRDAYPGTGLDRALGGIRGTVRGGSGPVRSALVAAVDPSTGTSVGALSSPVDGTYSIPWLPPGRYLVYAEPLDGPVRPASVGLAAEQVDAQFRTNFLGGSIAPSLLEVLPGITSAADIGVEDGPADSDLQSVVLGTLEASGDFRDTRGAHLLTAGIPVDMLFAGPGLDSVREDEIEFLGADVRVVPGSLRTESRLLFGGLPLRRVGLFVAARATRSTATLAIRRNGSAAVRSAGFVVEGVPVTPWFSPWDVVNAASLAPGGVVAGEIVAIIGRGLGPALGIGDSLLDPARGSLPTTLGGTRVEFDGIAAPLFFVSDQMIRAQVPVELAGRASAVVRVDFRGATSPGVPLRLLKARPGVFAAAGQAIASNQDGSPNGPRNPAPTGSEITFYGTGHGLADLSSAAVTIDGRPARLIAAGLRVDLVGVFEIRVVIPPATKSGGVALRVSIGDSGSQSGVAISVR